MSKRVLELVVVEVKSEKAEVRLVQTNIKSM
jgi:hypothetical protein